MDRLMPMLKAALNHFNLNSHFDDFKYHVSDENKLIETHGGGASIVADIDNMEKVLLKHDAVLIVVNDEVVVITPGGGKRVPVSGVSEIKLTAGDDQ